MAGKPFGGDIIKLKGENSRWQRRIGSYPIFFTGGSQRDCPPHLNNVLAFPVEGRQAKWGRMPSS